MFPSKGEMGKFWKRNRIIWTIAPKIPKHRKPNQHSLSEYWCQLNEIFVGWAWTNVPYFIDEREREREKENEKKKNQFCWSFHGEFYFWPEISH